MIITYAKLLAIEKGRITDPDILCAWFQQGAVFTFVVGGKLPIHFLLKDGQSRRMIETRDHGLVIQKQVVVDTKEWRTING